MGPFLRCTSFHEAAVAMSKRIPGRTDAKDERRASDRLPLIRNVRYTVLGEDSARLCGKERNFTGEHLWPAVTPSPRSASNWSKSANTSANKKLRMEQTDSFEPLLEARFSATPKLSK